MPPRPTALPQILKRFAHEATTTRTPSPSAPSTQSLQPPQPPQSSRTYPLRKQYLYEFYNHLFRRSEVALLFKRDNLTVSDLQKIRRAIAGIKLPSPSPPAPSSSSSSMEVGGSTSTSTLLEPAKLHIARTGILGAVTRRSSLQATKSLKPHLEGPVALLTISTLSPSYLSKVLAVITKVIKQSQKEVRPDQPPPKQPMMELVGGVLEKRKMLDSKEIGEVGKLPELSVLRSQLVGLLESPGRNALGLLGQAGGGGLVRTLQGLEKDLEGKEGEVKA